MEPRSDTSVQADAGGDSGHGASQESSSLSQQSRKRRSDLPAEEVEEDERQEEDNVEQDQDVDNADQEQGNMDEEQDGNDSDRGQDDADSDRGRDSDSDSERNRSSDDDRDYDDVENWDRQGKSFLEDAANGRVHALQIWLKDGVDVNQKDRRGNTALMIAAEANHWEAVEVLLDMSTRHNFNLRNRFGESVLSLACRSGSGRSVELLLKAGVKVGLQSKQGELCLSHAVKSNNEQGLKLIVEAFSAPERILIDCLYQAVEENQLETVEYLVSSIGVEKVSTLRRVYKTPLEVAIVNDAMNVASYLVNAGVDVNFEDQCALKKAVDEGAEEFCKLLIPHSSDINVKEDFSGRTLLYIAVVNGYVEIVKLLLEAGALVDLADKNGGTPFLCACKEGHQEIMSILKSAGCDINAQESKEEELNALMWSCANDKESLVQFLIDAGADLEKVNRTQDTALGIATEANFVHIVKLLVGAGANIEHKNRDGLTPLMVAAKNNCEETLSFLITSKANLDCQDSRQRTALMLACQGSHVNCFKLLLEAGADPEVKNDKDRTALEQIEDRLEKNAPATQRQRLVEMKDALLTGSR